MSIDIREAQTRDGIRIRYEVRGPSRAPCLALIHSLALDRTVWARVIDRLAKEFRILSYDCRGHGGSERPEGPYNAYQFADDLEDVLNDAEFASAIIVGCSMGGCVAQAFAIAKPSMTRALGLVDTTAWYGEDAPREWRARAMRPRAEGFQSLLDFQVTRWFSPPFVEKEPALIHLLASVFTANKLHAYEASCIMMGDTDLRSRLKEITAPTSILVGEEDYATPTSMAEYLNANIDGSTLRVLKGARHLTPLERPTEISELVRELARRAGG